MHLRGLTFVCALLAAMAAGSAMLRAEDQPTTMLVIDGSGSMWGRLPPDNRAKIDVIRDKLTNLLQSPSPTRVGLISFGHRRRGDCTDVEVLAAPANERTGLLGPLAKLSPRGPGPVTAAVKAAVDAIGTARPAQIIVVGDNADNCVPDTCAVAQDIARKAPGVVIQVIGVGVPAVERPRLMCLSQATGGRYYDIADSAGLDAAIDETTKLAILPPNDIASAPAVAPAGPPPPEGGALRASASLVDGGALLTTPLQWQIFKSGETVAIQETTGTSIAAKLPAGSYDITAKLGTIAARQHIDLVDGASEAMTVPLGAAHLTVSAGNGTTPSETATITVMSAGIPAAMARNGSMDLYLPPADYKIVAVDGAARAEKAVTLDAGDYKPVTLPLGTGRIDLTATNAPRSGDVLFTVYEDDPDSPSGRRRVARSRAPEPSFTLPAGTYYVSAKSGDADVQQRVAVGAGQTTREALNFAASNVSVSTIIAGAPAKAEYGVVYRVDRADGDHARVARAIGPKLDLTLAAGRYQITASLPKYHLTASKEVTVAAGAPAAVNVEIPSGTITFRPPPQSASAGTDGFWEVLDVSGNSIWRAVGGNATAVLAPGHYTVRLDVRGQRKQAAFDVEAGRAQNVELSPG